MKKVNSGNYEERKAAAIAKLELGRQTDAFRRAMHNQRMEEDPEYAKLHVRRRASHATLMAMAELGAVYNHLGRR